MHIREEFPKKIQNYSIFSFYSLDEFGILVYNIINFCCLHTFAFSLVST